METNGATDLVFFVNGIKIIEKNPDPEWTLLYYLRNKLHLTGTKLGCAEGGCGACTVMISRYNRDTLKIKHFSANACLAPLCAMHGLAVTTVEGIGSTRTRLHPVQERLAKSHGSQCGFCTPGIVMSMYTLLRNNCHPSVMEMEGAFEGNLCRCTGYRPILEGFRTLTKEMPCPMGANCCQNQNKDCQQTGDDPSCGGKKPRTDQDSSIPMRRALVNTEEFAPYDPSQEPIFPSELQLDSSLDSSSLYFRSERVRWYRPCQLSELLDLKRAYPEARLVVGNTEVGVETKFKNMHYPVIVSPSHVPELNEVKTGPEGVTLGGSVTLARLEHVLRDEISSQPDHRTRVFVAVVEMLRWFAGHQVRNVSAIAGNIMTASPISDLNPLWLAAGATLNVSSMECGERRIIMDHNFFPGYRRTQLKPDEVLVSITVPYTQQNEFFSGYKQAHRRDDDIAIVNAGMKVTFKEGTNIIENLALAYGGMAPTTVMAVKTMKGLVGKPWSEDLVPAACALLAEDLPLPPGVPGGSESYRRTLTTSFFFKFYLTVIEQLQQQQLCPETLPDTYQSAIPPYSRGPSQGVQVFEEVTGQPDDDPVGRPIVHLSALQQATGEARYCDDIPRYGNELYMALVQSKKAHARLVSVDPSAALAEPGVVDYINHKDVPGSNSISDEEIFATEKVVAEGQIIGCILAKDQLIAQRAAKLVKVQYEELKPIITIEEAIDANSYIKKPVRLVRGDVEAGFSESEHVLEGEVRIGGQEHFYLETQACLAVPKGEAGELELYVSSQTLHKSQLLMAEALGVPANRIVVHIKRIGGGFGGKETRTTLTSVPAGLAAHKHNVPVRIMLDRDEDMIMTGTRHPALARYKVGFTSEGKVLALKADIYANCGYSIDLSISVVNRMVTHCENAYNIPHFHVLGHTCKTNIPSNTAFRGFGGPQGMMVGEQMMTHVAEFLKLPPEKVREMNIYTAGDTTPYNMPVENSNVRRCWDEVKVQSNFSVRSEEIATFNRQNRWKKRGISLIPTKYGICFEAQFLNQGGALVLVYTDGSVLVSHGGIEMGQGLHTKVIQCASRALKIPTSKIFISESTSNIVPNTSPSAASSGSDLYGPAVIDACQTILGRLQPYITAKPDDTWEQWVTAAYFDRVSLSACGFFKVPEIGYDWATGEGRLYSYFTNGAACTEVEIDCLTGDHTVLRTDIVMDLGRSLNPAVDIGQIEGAFVQGYGMFVLEEQRYSPKGVLYTRGPGMYKIPGFSDIPREFNVSLLKGSSNPRAVYSSKAVGEPPLFLSSSALFAIKDAILAARKDAGCPEFFHLDSPATAEKIRLHCVDQFTKQFPAPEKGSYTPWSVQL